MVDAADGAADSDAVDERDVDVVADAAVGDGDAARLADFAASSLAAGLDAASDVGDVAFGLTPSASSMASLARRSASRFCSR